MAWQTNRTAFPYVENGTTPQQATVELQRGMASEEISAGQANSQGNNTGAQAVTWVDPGPKYEPTSEQGCWDPGGLAGYV
eukprot:CAMPEP_0174359548 /NCGR_PEP_ID=MMETSP0811_2-20130205/49286_1 /TAXON_ID=73025 ORGANISM="Eutreptiella gymnastica-like, Strain CCMP1594" /NCGR_SAMPLE_ID=MMETSP0811_2 /ASSEMBLY_ACC=CAM_ASM_000667 /LENGTH=79 /DNA_ID=CAMNT_0015494367 /DNA_START=370 /DNA_END=605 /DNA_ORIENTATION=+